MYQPLRSIAIGSLQTFHSITMGILSVSLLMLGFMLQLCILHFRTRLPFRAPYRILACIYLGFSLWILINSLNYMVDSHRVPALRLFALPVDTALLYCLNPLIYFFYRKLQCDSPECIWRKVLPHFIAPILALLFLPVYELLSVSMQRQALLLNSFDAGWLPTLLFWGFCLQSIGYVGYLHTSILKYKSDNYLLRREDMWLSLRKFRGVLSVGLGVVLLHGGFFHLGHWSMEHHQTFRLMSANVLSFMLIGLSLKDTGTQTIPLRKNDEPEEDVLPEAPRATEGFDKQTSAGKKPRAEATALSEKESLVKKALVSEDEKNRMMQTLRALMETEKLYLQADCHLDLLAERLKTCKSILSYVLNCEGECGCVHFINEYRLQHALTLIDQGAYRTLNVDTIAKMSGFSNRINFFRACKELRGFTPSDYIQEKKNQK